MKATWPVKPSCIVLLLFSLSEVHTKKVRKVPPGLPSSVSDNMPFLLLFRTCYRCFKCVSQKKRLLILRHVDESLSWFCGRKKHEVVEKLHTLPGFVNLSRWRWRCCRSRAGHKQLSAFCCRFLFWGNQLEEFHARINNPTLRKIVYCCKSKEM